MQNKRHIWNQRTKIHQKPYATLKNIFQKHLTCTPPGWFFHKFFPVVPYGENIFGKYFSMLHKVSGVFLCADFKYDVYFAWKWIIDTQNLEIRSHFSHISCLLWKKWVFSTTVKYIFKRIRNFFSHHMTSKMIENNGVSNEASDTWCIFGMVQSIFLGGCLLVFNACLTMWYVNTIKPTSLVAVFHAASNEHIFKRTS